MEIGIKTDDNLKSKENKLKYLFLFALIIMILLFFNFPSLQEEDRIIFNRFPNSPKDIKMIVEIVQKYTKDNNLYILIGFCYLYIFLQSFAIPGPLILSILASPLFGKFYGFLIVCFCATFGATVCYLLSQALGKQLVLRKFTNKVKGLQKLVDQYKNQQIYLILFLRITPILPNFFVNLASPIVEIKLLNFIIGTFFGLMPANIIHLQTGSYLNDVTQIGLSFQNILFLFALGVFAALPLIYKKDKIKD